MSSSTPDIVSDASVLTSESPEIGPVSSAPSLKIDEGQIKPENNYPGYFPERVCAYNLL